MVVAFFLVCCSVVSMSTFTRLSTFFFFFFQIKQRRYSSVWHFAVVKTFKSKSDTTNVASSSPFTSCPVHSRQRSISPTQSHNPLWTCWSAWKRLLPDPYHFVKTRRALRQHIAVIGLVRLSDHWSRAIQLTINGRLLLGCVVNQYHIRGGTDVTLALTVD